MGFPRQEYWSGLPSPPPGDLPNPGIEPRSSALAGVFFSTAPPGKPNVMCMYYILHIICIKCMANSIHFKKFYWSIVDLHCFVNFCYTAKWLSYTYIYSFSYYFPLWLIPDINYISNSFLCCTVGLCCLSILHVIGWQICLCQSWTSPVPTPPSPLRTASLSSMSVGLFLFCRYVDLCCILDSTCTW